jgi:TatD DNase family protein
MPFEAVSFSLINFSRKMYIDTHAHLNYPDIAGEIDDIILRAVDSGVEYIIVPATDYSSSLEVIELLQKHNILFGAIGIHPTELAGFLEKQLHEIDELTSSDKIVAIGEIGLDYYWKPYDKGLQHYVLKSQLQIALSRNLPVILHNRESSDDLINIIAQFQRLRGQFHSFSGDEQMAEKCIGMGFYISFTGNLTYKPNEKTFTAHKIVKHTSMEHMLLETDTPYLPPVPYRGKLNEPAYIKYTAEKIAELKEITVDEVGRITTNNAKALFGL